MKLVRCIDCGIEDVPAEMAYQGKDGPEHTAPGSAFDYYLCQDCEDFYKRAEAIEDDESDDAFPCRECGLLFHRGTFVCPVCFTERF